MKFPILLTFDFDAEFVMENMYGDDPYWVSQGQYGANEGVARILRLLEREGIKASFCIVGKSAEKYPDAVKSIARAGHETAVHGWTHKYYNALTKTEEERGIRKTRGLLEKLTGVTPRGHRTPGWRPSKNTISILEKEGFLWNSDYLGCDMPFFNYVGKRKTRVLEIPVAYTLDDWDLFYSHGNTPQMVFEVWKEEFDHLYDEKKMLCLTCHPLVSGRPSRIGALERFIHYTKTFNVEFMRCCDFAEMWRK